MVYVHFQEVVQRETWILKRWYVFLFGVPMKSVRHISRFHRDVASLHQHRVKPYEKDTPQKFRSTDPENREYDITILVNNRKFKAGKVVKRYWWLVTEALEATIPLPPPAPPLTKGGSILLDFSYLSQFLAKLNIGNCSPYKIGIQTRNNRMQ